MTAVGEDQSLFERLMKNEKEWLSYDRSMPYLSKMLSIQYRMNEILCQPSSECFYENKLISDQSNQQITVRDLLPQQSLRTPSLIDPTTCLLWVDHNCLETYEDKKNIWNKEEISLTLFMI